MMYNQEQRSALEEAAAVVRRAELATMGLAPENELRQQADALRRAVFARKKDFESLRNKAAALRERLDTPEITETVSMSTHAHRQRRAGDRGAGRGN